MISVGNYGDKAVVVNDICARNDNLFTSVGQEIRPGDVLDRPVAVAGEPAFIWLDTNESIPL